MNSILRSGFLFLVCVNIILIVSCNRNTVVPSKIDAISDKVTLFPLKERGGIFYANVVPRSDLNEEKNISPQKEIRACKPYPNQLSKKYDKEIVKSKEFYEHDEYQKAASILKLPLEREPNNPFILEAYAKALFRQNLRQESFIHYKRLIDILDSNSEAKKSGVRVNDIVIDCWFTDAYWKHAILLSDQSEWAKASFEISRFLVATPDLCSTQSVICIQAFSYLAEAYYEMKKYDLAEYYAKVVLKLDPSNEYVKKYLVKMN